jgi:drug/metabolite transporter (DMT)-like permease
MSCVQFAVVTVVSLVCAIFFEQPVSLDGITSAIGPILMLGIGSSGIAYTLQIVAQSNLNPTVASIVMSLESVFGVVGSAIFLGETMSTREYFGCAIVFTAVVLSQLDFSSLKKRKTSE